MDFEKISFGWGNVAARRSTWTLEVTFQGALHPAATTGNLSDMARPLATIEEEIRELSVADKETLLRVLWQELDGPADSEVYAEWLREAQRRSREIDDDSVECIPAEKVFARLEALTEK
jgi:putative addiction module component (TIGR02574 family)